MYQYTPRGIYSVKQLPRLGRTKAKLRYAVSTSTWAEMPQLCKNLTPTAPVLTSASVDDWQPGGITSVHLQYKTRELYLEVHLVLCAVNHPLSCLLICQGIQLKCMLSRQKEKKKKKPKQRDEEKENERSSKHIPIQKVPEYGDFVHLIQTSHEKVVHTRTLQD